MRVQLPFGRRAVVGLILRVGGHSDVAPEKLRDASALLDATPLLSSS